MAQTPTSSTPSTTASTNDAQALNSVEPGNTANAQVAANLAGTTSTIASADAPAAVRGVDMGMIKDVSGPNINAAALDASAKIQTREAQVQANPALINASAKSGPIGYTAMNFGKVEALNKPSAGRTTTVHADAGEQFKVNFDPNAAQLSVRNGDLTFAFNDGSRIVIDHFVMAGNQMPSLLLPDGTLLAGGVVVAQLTGQNADDLFNIETAAGPAAGGVAGAGGFTYSDDLGGVIGLLDKLPPIPFTQLVFPTPSDEIIPFVFPVNAPPVNFVPGLQPNYAGYVDETDGFNNNTQTGTITPDYGRDGAGALTLTPTFFADNHTGTTDGTLYSNGEEVKTTLVGNVITGADANGNIIFTLTLDPTTGAYIFDLKGQLDHDDPFDTNEGINLHFQYQVTDSTGDTAIGNITIVVADDAPEARDDFRTLLNNDTVTGNVITGMGNINVDGADRLSNDDTDGFGVVNEPGLQNIILGVVNQLGQTYSFLDDNGDPAPDVTTQPDGNGGERLSITINGQYGVLTLYSDGNYSYTHTTGTGILQDKFAYVLFDDDLDSSPAVLTIDINDSVPTVPPVQTADLNGSGNNAVDETVSIGQAYSGTVSFMAGDNSTATVAFGDVNHAAVFVAEGSLANNTLTSNGQPVTVILTFDNHYVGYTGTDPDAAGAKVFELVLNNGEGGYTFTQFSNLDHADGSNPNDVITLNFGVTATDADGDTSDTGLLQINVLDDAPIANPDVNMAVRMIREFNVIANSPSFPSLQEEGNLPERNPDLYAQGVAKASNVNLDVPTTITIERIVDTGFRTIFRSPLFAFTSTEANALGNVKLVFGLGSSNPDDSGPTSASYAMETGGKLGFFIAQNATDALRQIGAVDQDGTINPNISFSVVADGNNGYKIQYTDATGAHDLIVRDAAQNQNVAVPMFSGNLIPGQPVHGVAGREEGDASNVIRYGFEDLVKQYSDEDYNDVQFKVTINPTTITTNPTIDGNVITGRNGGDGAADHVGQDDLSPVNQVTTDGTKLTQVSFANGAYAAFAGVNNVDAGGKFMTVEGAHGTLKIYENGEYTYMYNKPNTGSSSEVFHYTIIDNDGDTSTTTLTINLDNNFIPSVSNNGAVLNEADLPGPDSVTQSITIASVEGVSNVVLTTNGLPNLQALGQNVSYSVSPDGHTLTATANGQTIFTVAVGATVSGANNSFTAPYTFTLFQPLDNPGTDTNTTNIPVQFAVTDNSGDVVNTTVPLQVIDDVPVARDDAFGLGVGMTVSNNVLSNDDFGADGRGTPALTSVTFNSDVKTVDNGSPAVFTGANGESLTVSADGSFTYTRPSGFGNVTPSFTYVIKDHDGDTSQARVTINGDDNPVIVVTPPEGGVDAGAPGVALFEHAIITATDPAQPPTIHETITVTAIDGLSNIVLSTDGLPSLTANGLPVNYGLSPDGSVLTGSTATGVGIFVVYLDQPVSQGNGSYTVPYTFTLFQPLDNPGTGQNVTNIPVNFTVTDTDGDSDVGTLPLQVIDDVPVARDDVLMLGNAQSSPMDDSNNLLVNDTFGADGPAVGSLIDGVTKDGVTKNFATPDGTDGNGIRFVIFTNAAGTLKVTENGTYSFARPDGANGPLNQPFSYTIKDHDGDISRANVSITGDVDNPVIITTPDPRDPNGTGVNAPGVIVDEHGFVTDMGAYPTASSTIVFTAPDGFAAIAINTNGLPQLTSDGQPVTYNVDDDGHTLYGSINQNGGQVTVLAVMIDNVTPTAQNGSYQLAYNFVLLQPLDNAGNGRNVTDLPVQFTVSDTDGDTASATLPLKIIDDVPVAADDSLNLNLSASGNGTNLLVNDAFNADGPFADVAHVNSVSYAGQTKDFGTPTGVENNVKFVSFTTDAGTLRVFENGEYSFSRANPNTPLNQQFSYTIKDHDGDVSAANVTITGAFNDNPVTILSPAVDAAGAIIPESALLIPGIDIVTNQIAFTAPDGVQSVRMTLDGLPVLTSHDQTVAYSIAADGRNMSGTINNGQTLVFNVVLGDVVQQGDGSYRAGYSFSLNQALDNPGAGQNVTGIPVQFVVTDTDGDQAGGTLPLQVIDHTPSVNTANHEVDETSGVGQSDFNNVSGNIMPNFGADGPANSNPFALTGLTIDGATNANSLTSGGVPVTIVAEGATGYVGLINGGTAVFRLSVDAQGNYAFHQYKPLDHNNTNDGNETISFHVGYNVTDHDGDVASGSVTIAVHDDAPITNNDDNQLTISTYTFNVLGGAPDFPSLVEYKHLPENQPDLYQQGVAKASNVMIDRPTTIDIERIVDTGASVAGRSPVFACTLRADGTIGNIQLVLSNGSSDPQYASGPDHTTYTMTDAGKLGFFIVSGGTIALEYEGVIDSQGNLKAGYSFGLAPDTDGHGYVVQYTSPDGVTHNLPFYEADGSISNATTEARFAGGAFDTPDSTEFGLVHGIAGRETDDAANTLRYAFEDGNLRDPGNDRDYNDVQFKITVNPTVVQVSPPISGNVLPNDRVGADVVANRNYDTLVTQIALGMGAFVDVETAPQTDSNGRYVDIQGEYGVLRMHENGEYTYNFNGNKTGGDLVDDFRYTIRDADGDTSNVSTLTIYIQDDGQVNGQANASFARTATSVALVAEDDHSAFVAAKAAVDVRGDHSSDMYHDILPVQADQDILAKAANAELAGHVVAGQVADGGHDHFALQAHVDGNLTSNGKSIDMHMADGTLHGSVDGQDVFTLAMDDKGHYQFNLQGSIDQADKGTTLAFGYTAQDGAGSAVEGQVMFNVQGDHAVAVNTNSLNLHDLISPPADTSAHVDVAVNTVSTLDIIHSILDDHNPANGYHS